MGILGRLLGGQPKIQEFTASHLKPERDSAALDIVGEQSYQENLVSISGGMTTEGPAQRDHMAALMLEPNNQFDPNAIAVYVSGTKGGYLSRENAILYGPVLRWLVAQGQILAADAYLTGGWRRSATDQGSIGVVLHLGSPAECMADLLSGLRSLRTDHPWQGRVVAFTGDSHCYLGDVPIDRHALQWYAMKAGMVIHPRVTKKVQLVVLCDESGLTINGQKAREYGIPTVTEREFWQGLGVPVTDIGRPVHGWGSRNT